MKKFKIKERKVLFDSNETLHEDVDTENILLKIRRKYGLTEERKDVLKGPTGTVDPSRSISSVDDPKGALKIHHISNEGNAFGKVTQEEQCSPPKNVDFIPKSLFNLTQPIGEDLDHVEEILESLKGILPKDPIKCDSSIEELHEGSIEAPQGSIQVVNSKSTRSLGRVSIQNKMSCSKNTDISDPISYISTPRQSPAKEPSIFAKNEINGFANAKGSTSLHPWEASSQTAQSRNSVASLAQDEHIPIEKLEEKIYGEILNGDLVHVYDKFAENEGLAPAASSNSLLNSNKNFINRSVQTEELVPATKGMPEIVDSELTDPAEQDDLKSDKDNGRIPQLCQTDVVALEIPNETINICNVSSDIGTDASVQTENVGLHMVNEVCQTEAFSISKNDSITQTEIPQLSPKETQTIPVHTLMDNNYTQTDSSSFNIEYATKLSEVLDSDDESRKWLRHRLKLKLESLRKPLDKNKLRQPAPAGNVSPDKTAPRTSHEVKTVEDIKTHRFSNVPNDLISDLSASDGNEGDMLVKLAALQDKNRSNASVDNSPYAEHYSDIASHSSESSVLDLHASNDSLPSNPFGSGTIQNPLYSSQSNPVDPGRNSTTHTQPKTNTLQDKSSKPKSVNSDEKSLAEKNVNSLQSVTAQLKLANDLAQKMMAKRNPVIGGINRMAVKVPSFENLQSTPRASVLSSTEPVLLYNEFEAYKKSATETIARLEQKLADEEVIKQRLKIIQIENEQLEKQNAKLIEENNLFKIKLLDAENSAMLLKNSMDAQKAELDGLKKNAGELGFVRQEAKKRSSTPPGALQFTPPLVNVLSPSSPLKNEAKLDESPNKMPGKQAPAIPARKMTLAVDTANASASASVPLNAAPVLLKKDASNISLPVPSPTSGRKVSITVPPPPPLTLKKTNSQIESPTGSQSSTPRKQSIASSNQPSKKVNEFETLKEEELRDKELIKELSAKVESLSGILVNANADNSKLTEMKNSLEKKLSDLKANYQKKLEKILKVLSSSKPNPKELDLINVELKSSETKEVFGDVSSALFQKVLAQQPKTNLNLGKTDELSLKKYEADCQALRDSLAKVNAEKDSLDKKIKEMDKMAVESKNNNGKNGNQDLLISKLSSEKQAMEIQIVSLEQEIRELEEISKNQINSLKVQMMNDKDVSDKKVIQLDGEMRKLIEKNAALSQSLDDARLKLQEMTDRKGEEDIDGKEILEEILAKKESDLEVAIRNLEQTKEFLQRETKANVELSEKNSQLSLANSEIESQKAVLTKKLQEVQKKLSETQVLLERRENEKEDLQFDNDKLFNDLDEEKSEVTKLKSALKYVEAAKADFEESSKSWKAKYDAIDKELKNYYQSTRSSFAEHKVDKDRLEETVKTWKDKYETSQVELIGISAKLESLQIETGQLKSSVTLLQQENERQKSSFAAERQELTLRLEENEKELIAYEEELNEMKEKYLETKMAHQEQFAKNKSLMASNDRLFNDTPEDESNLKSLDAKIKELDQKIIELGKELEISKISLEEQKRVNQELEEINKTVSRSCVETEKIKNSLEGTIMRLEDETQEWKRKFEENQNNSRQSNVHVRELNSKIEQLEANISMEAEGKKSLVVAKQNLETSLAFWKKKHDSVVNTFEQHQASQAVQQATDSEKIMELEEKIIELENNVHIAKKKLEDERKSCLHWKNQYEKQTNEIIEVRQSLESCTQDSKELKEKIMLLESENLMSLNNLHALEKFIAVNVLSLHNLAGVDPSGNAFTFGNQSKDRNLVTQFETGFKELETSITNLNSKLELVEAQKIQMQRKFTQDLSSQQSKFQIEAAGYQNEINDLKDQIDVHRSNAAKVSKQFEDSRKKLAQIENLNVNLTEQITNLTANNELKENALKLADGKVTDLKNRLQQSESLRLEVESKVNDNLQNSKLKFADNVEGLEKKIAELSENLDYYKSVNLKLSKAVEDSRKKIVNSQEANQILSKLEDEIAEKNETLKAFEATLKENKMKFQNLQQKIDDQTKIIDEANKTQSRMTEQLNECEKEISELRENLDNERLTSARLNKVISDSKRKTMLVAASSSEQEEKAQKLEQQIVELELDFKRKIASANNQVASLQEKEKNLLKKLDEVVQSAESEIQQKYEFGKIQIQSLQEKEKGLKTQLEAAQSQIQALKTQMDDTVAFHRLETEKEHGGLHSLQYQLKMVERELISEKAKYQTADLNWQETIHHNQVLNSTISSLQKELNATRYKYDHVVQEQTKLDLEMEKTVGTLQSKISAQRQTIIDFRILQQEKEILMKDFENMKRTLDKTAAEKLELEQLLGPKEQPNGQILSIEQLKANYIQAPLLAKLKEMEKEMEAVNSRLLKSNITNAENQAMVEKMKTVQKQHYNVSQKMKNQFERDIAKTSKMLDDLFTKRKKNDAQRLVNENLLKYAYERKIQNLLQKRRYAAK